NNLAGVLAEKGDWEGAIASWKEAIAIKPDYAVAHYNLGRALVRKGQLDEAIAAYREALRLKPDFPEAHCNLGHALREAGRFAEALPPLQRGHERGSRQKRGPSPSAHWIKEYQRLVELDGRLPAILKGDAKPAGAAEQVEFAKLCYYKRLFGRAARFWEDAF